MARIVVSTSEVLDYFANQSQSEARASKSYTQSGWSVMYKDGIIYTHSRYFPIGRHVTNAQGQVAILITSKDLSCFPSNHVGRLIYAAQHVKQIFAPDVTTDNHAQNFADFQADAEEMIVRVKKAKSVDSIVRMFEKLKVQVADYAEFYGLEIPESLSAVMEMSGDTLDIIKEKMEAAKIAAAKRDEKDLEAHLESVENFRKGTNNYIRRYYGSTPSPLAISHNILRYNERNERVETSGGVQIPKTIAQRFYQNIVRGIRDKDFRTLIGQQVLHYTVRSFNANQIQIGCHNIPMSEIDTLAKSLGWDKLESTKQTKTSRVIKDRSERPRRPISDFGLVIG